MTNHPNRSRTYWFSCPRGFANEYSIGIATTRQARDVYKDWGPCQRPSVVRYASTHTEMT